MFTPVLHVPLVLRLPFAIQPTRILAQVRNLDVAPTLLDLAGLPPDPAFEFCCITVFPSHNRMPVLVSTSLARALTVVAVLST